MELLHQFFGIFHEEGMRQAIQWGGVGVICLIIYAETGFFALLPGDSLLVVAGMLALGSSEQPAILNIWALLTLPTLCAIAGDQTGYFLGRKAGGALLRKRDVVWLGIPIFRQRWLKQTQDYYTQHGVKTVVMARWVPIVRTFAPIVAGMGRMDYRRFVTFNIIGGISWVWSMVLTGYFLSTLARNMGFDLAKNIDRVALVIIALSLIPIVLHVLKDRRAGAKGSSKAPKKPKRAKAKK